MTDLVEVIDRKIEDDAIGGDTASRDRDGSKGSQTSRSPS
jgi:hypothetical protein